MSLFKSYRRKLIILPVIFFSFSIAEGKEVSVDKAFELFYNKNYDILINKYEVNKATADLLSAQQLLNPNLSTNYTGLNLSGKDLLHDTTNTQLSVRVEQPIELGNKRGLRIAYAEENIEAAKLDYQEAIRGLLAGFYTAYYNLCLDKLNIDFSKGELERFEKTFAVAEKKFNSGFLSLNDYTKLKINKIELENNLANLKTRYFSDLESFNLLIGSSENYEPAEAAVINGFEGYNEEKLVELAYQKRTDLLSAERQIRASEYNVSLAKAYRIPDLTIGVEYETFGLDYKPGVGIGISLNIPLFNRNQGEISRRLAEREQLKIQMEKIKRQILTDIRQVLNNYNNSIKIFDSYRTRKNEADELLENSEKSFSLGGITVLDLLDTRKTYKEFMTNYNQTFIQAILNKELLKVYTGEIR